MSFNSNLDALIFKTTFQWLFVTAGLSIYNAIYTASEMTGTSKQTLTNVVKEFGKHGNVKGNRKLRRSKDFFERMTPYQMELMRWIVHEEFRKCNTKQKDPNSSESATVPTIQSLLKEIQDKYHEVLPPLTKEKLRLCLHRLGFQYKKHPDTKNVLLIGK